MAAIILPQRWARQPLGPWEPSSSGHDVGIVQAIPLAGSLDTWQGNHKPVARDAGTVAFSAHADERGRPVVLGRFDNATRLTAPAIPFSGTQPFTFAFLGRLDPAAASYHVLYCVVAQGQTNAFMVSRSPGDASYGKVTVGQTGIGQSFGPVGTASVGTMDRIVLVGRGGISSTTTADWDIWINGVKETTSVTGNWNARTGDWIGCESGPTYFWYGLVGEIVLARKAWGSAEVRAYYENPYQFFRPLRRRLYIPSAAAGGVTVTPDAGQLTLTGYAPTISRTEHQIIAPDKGNLTLTGFAPSISVSTGADVTVNPDAGQLTLTGYAPTISKTAHQIVNPDRGDLTLTGYAPTINQTAHVIVNPATGALVITGYAPTIGQGVTVTPNAGQLTLTGYAPTITVSGNAYINADTGQLVLTGYAPDISVTGQAAATTLGGGAGSARRRRRWLVQKDDETMEFQDLQQALTWLEEKPEAPETPKRGRPRTRKVVNVPQIVLYEDVDVSNLKIGRMTLAKALTRGVDLDELEAKVRAYLEDEEQAAIAAVLY